MEGLNQRFWRAGRISVFGLLILAVWMSGCSHAKVRMKRDVDQEMRGVWVTTAWGLDYPAEPSVSAEELRRQAGAAMLGCPVQVRHLPME